MDKLRFIAFIDAVTRLLKSKRRKKLLTLEQIHQRLDICKQCDNFTGGYCKLCGCCTNEHRTFFNKVAFPTEKCPNNPPKWLEFGEIQMKMNGLANVKFDADLIAQMRANPEGVKAKGIWEIECYDKDGNLKWKDTFHNMVVNEGLNHILSIVLAVGTQITSWFVGLTASSPSPAAGDIMSSHAGWTEVHTEYSQANRPAFTPGSVSGQSVDNSASKAQFSITGSVTVGGAFLTSNNTKNGTTGTLYSVGAFSGGNRALINGDTLNVQCTFTQADDGV